MSRLYDIWTRGYGESQIRRKQVAESDLKRHRELGWALATEPLPIPAPPDLEVLELKLKDATALVDEAKRALAGAEGRQNDAARAFQAAKAAMASEPGILSEIQNEHARIRAEEEARRRLHASGNKPVKLGDLVRSADSDVLAKTVRRLFENEYHVVGKAPDGDYLVVANKTLYVKEKAEREAAEAAEKERAVRARMEASK